MPDRRVNAIYFSMLRRGAFEQPKEPEFTEVVKKEAYHQMNFFDIWGREDIIERIG